MSMHPNRNLFAEYKNKHRVFIETGTYRGDGIALAMAAGFERIISIDIDEQNTEFCKSRFDFRKNDGIIGRSRITLVTGSSPRVLPEILSEIREPCLFWLDAHAQYLEGEADFEDDYPLLDELEIIYHWGRKGSTIMVDDMLHLTHPEVTGWTKERVELAVLHAVGPVRAQIEYFANPVRNSILVAYVR